MIKLIDLLFAARPALHMPIWSVYIVALVIAGKGQLAFQSIDLLALLALSLVAGGAFLLNQLNDIESDRINRKLGFLQRGLLARGRMEAAYLVATAGGLVLGGFVSLLFVTLVAVQSILGYLYSCSPLRLKDRPVAGLLVNAVCFGLLIPLTVAASRGTYFHKPELLLGLYFFLAVASTHILTTIPDRTGDAASGKRTIAVVMSDRTAHFVAMMLAVVSLGPALLLGSVPLMALSGAAILVILIAMLGRRERLTLLAAKLPLALLTLYAGYRHPYYFLFIVALLFSTRIYYRQRFGQTYPKLA